MKVVLLQDIKKLGKKLDVIEIKDGYARNFLIPRGFAILADKMALKKQAAIKKQEKDKLVKYEESAKKLAREKLELSLKTGKGGSVFGSIDKKDIKNVVENLGYKDFEVLLSRPIKTLGEYKVEISFPYGIKIQVKVIVSAR